MMITKTVLMLALASLAAVADAAEQTGRASARAAAESADVFPFLASERTLANGLKVIVVPTGLPNIVSIQIPVQTGSRNEVEPGKSGFAHFFEHMMSRGTKAYPPEKYQQILTTMGARQNAYTTDDYTNYHTTFAKEDLEILLAVEADRFQNLDYSEEAFKTESRAVLGEYNKSSADPSFKLFEAMRKAAYLKHTYRHTTMGFLEDIEDMPNQYAYSKIFFDRWYRPENTTLIVAGDVTASEVFPLVEKYWGKWKRGSYKAQIPAEPAPKEPAYVHVSWPSPTLPLVWVAFHAPPFSETLADHAALASLLDLSFGPTSELYKRLVESEQKVDQLRTFAPGRVDPAMVVVAVRVKKSEDTVYVRDAILRVAAQLRTAPVSAQRLADAKAAGKYGLIRSLDNTEQIAATLAGFVRYRRAYATINEYYRMVDTLTPDDLSATARKYLTDEGIVVATLAHNPLPPGIAEIPKLASMAAGGDTTPKFAFVTQKSVLPQIRFKLLFTVGSAQDPPGKEGLAALTAAMVARAGSRERKIDEIARAFFPLAGSFAEQVDKEMTTFTGTIHKQNWQSFTEIALPMLVAPGFREEDFLRLKDAQRNSLVVDLMNNNEEEFAKERLQTTVFAGTPYGHPVLGTRKGIDSITLDDVREFWRAAYTQGALRVGVAGDISESLIATLQQELAKLPPGAGLPAVQTVVGRRPRGIEVEVLQKDTRATAISFGFPIEVTRSHPDFAALWLAKTWLGEHRESVSHLWQRMRDLRGLNYGDYAYIEAFPRGMFQFFPDPNLGRKAQLFEVWIRPVLPENAQFALRIAIYELTKLVDQGLTKDEFETTRAYLMKNVFLMTATQDQQLGYALDAQWYATPEFTRMMRDALERLTVDDVNKAIRKHLAPTDLSVVMITKDAAGLKEKLVADGFSPIKYDAAKPEEVLAEDKVIGSLKLGIASESVRITPAAQAYAE